MCLYVDMKLINLDFGSISPHLCQLFIIVLHIDLMKPSLEKHIKTSIPLNEVVVPVQINEIYQLP